MKLKLDGTGLEKQKLKILCCEKEDILVTCKGEDLSSEIWILYSLIYGFVLQLAFKPMLISAPH